MSSPAPRTVLPRGDDTSYLSPGGVKGLSISVVFTTLATCFVLARLYTRTRLMNRMESNDWMIVIALVLSFVFMGLFIVEALNGVGMHAVDIPPPVMLKQMKAFWVTIPFYNAALLCAKASILMQYFRVFPTRRMRCISWIMIAVLATYGTWAVLSAFLNCIPVAKFWDPTLPGYCLSMKGLWFSNASMHIATDLAILLIPLPVLSALDLPRRQKIALMSIFALGGFVCVTSVCRLVALKKIADSDDPTYDNVDAATWSAIECNTGIICACLPTLRPLISRILPHLLSTLSTGGPSYGNAPLSQARTPAYWNGTGTVSTTITAMDDLEYGHCTSDADRVLTLAPGTDANGKEKLMLKDAKVSQELKEAAVTIESRTESSSSSSSPPR
ncbi:integral membrane protein [Aspergillus steynii IBT 23096]|uniref:Integral membrane protein n=1 Tax=Aspergillus steynii IBT 23096 TaxID=1392250 RepID=A0A2I2FRA5_9EURO|nr:uncharacterized protein P170DRAFT_431106 [Aspergillus steynii IBT 23096]PLB43139.1 integral membrane protein [Aspergillus steynii IBT 23096]